jgi:hypothetical protein
LLLLSASQVDIVVIPGRDEVANPEFSNVVTFGWIPGSALRGAPE